MFLLLFVCYFSYIHFVAVSERFVTIFKIGVFPVRWVLDLVDTNINKTSLVLELVVNTEIKSQRLGP